MKFNDKVYNVLKWIVIIFVPAVETLITTLGLLYGFKTEIIIGTIAAVATFVGALIGISSKTYNREKNEAIAE